MANVIETDYGIVIIVRSSGGTAPDTSTPSSLVQDDAPSLVGSAAPVASAPTAGQGFTLDAQGRIPTSVPVTACTMLSSDPPNAVVGQFWYRTDLDKLSVQTAAGVRRSAVFV